MRLGKDIAYFKELNMIAAEAEAKATDAKLQLATQEEKQRNATIAKEEVETRKYETTSAL